MKKIAAFATMTVLLVGVGNAAASAREARPGDHRGTDVGTVQVVEAPAVEAAEVDAAAVEAPEVEAAEVDAAAVEAPEVEAAEVDAAAVEAPEVEAAEVEAAEVDAAAVE